MLCAGYCDDVSGNTVIPPPNGTGEYLFLIPPEPTVPSFIDTTLQQSGPQVLGMSYGSDLFLLVNNPDPTVNLPQFWRSADGAHTWSKPSTTGMFGGITDPYRWNSFWQPGQRYVTFVFTQSTSNTGPWSSMLQDFDLATKTWGSVYATGGPLLGFGGGDDNEGLQVNIGRRSDGSVILVRGEVNQFGTPPNNYADYSIWSGGSWSGFTRFDLNTDNVPQFWVDSNNRAHCMYFSHNGPGNSGVTGYLNIDSSGVRSTPKYFNSLAAGSGEFIIVDDVNNHVYIIGIIGSPPTLWVLKSDTRTPSTFTEFDLTINNPQSFVTVQMLSSGVLTIGYIAGSVAFPTFASAAIWFTTFNGASFSTASEFNDVETSGNVDLSAFYFWPISFGAISSINFAYSGRLYAI